MGTLPPIYQRAEWRNTTPCDENDGRMGVGFDLADGSVIRLSITQDSANMLATSIDDFLQLAGVRPHSETSDGIPSRSVAILPGVEKQ